MPTSEVNRIDSCRLGGLIRLELIASGEEEEEEENVDEEEDEDVKGGEEPEGKEGARKRAATEGTMFSSESRGRRRNPKNAKKQSTPGVKKNLPGTCHFLRSSLLL
jgi:hypothetical protein